MSRFRAPILLLLALAACGPEFEPSYLIQSERVLAIRVDPPEAVPGQRVTFTPLVVGPKGTLEAGADFEAEWWRCRDDRGDPLEDEYICPGPGERLSLSREVPFEDEIPLDFFPLPKEGEEGLPDAKLAGAVLGYWRVAGLTMTASERVVDAFKRVVVYAPVPLGLVDERLADLDVRVDEEGYLVPNTNPLLLGVEIREETPDGPSVERLKAGRTYFFRPRYDERELQPYFSLKVDLKGLNLEDPRSLAALSDEELLSRFTRVRRCEVPLFSWYVTAGELRRETTLDERVVEDLYAKAGIECPPVEGEPRRPEVRYTAPAGDDVPEGGVVEAWVVMRDGRGGTDFRSFSFSVE